MISCPHFFSWAQNHLLSLIQPTQPKKKVGVFIPNFHFAEPHFSSATHNLWLIACLTSHFSNPKSDISTTQFSHPWWFSGDKASIDGSFALGFKLNFILTWIEMLELKSMRIHLSPTSLTVNFSSNCQSWRCWLVWSSTWPTIFLSPPRLFFNQPLIWLVVC